MPLMVTTPQREVLRHTAPAQLPQGLAAVLKHNHTRVMDLFRVADENLDGVVSKVELSSLLNKLGIEVRNDELHDLFSWLDPDGSGGIEFRELQSALRQAADAPPPAAPPPAQCHGSATCLAPTVAAQRLDEDLGPPTAAELRMLKEMLEVATAGVAAELAAEQRSPLRREQTRRPADGVNLLRMLSAYERVLERHAIAPIEDTRYYQLLLRASLLPHPSWHDKVARAKARALARALALALARA